MPPKPEPDAHADELSAFRSAVRAWVQAELAPPYTEWERTGNVGRDIWRKAGAAGLLGPTIAADYGGAGLDFRFTRAVIEEIGLAGFTAPRFSTHTDTVAHTVNRVGTQDQKRGWLPGMVAGTTIGAYAVTEPNAGSDLAAIETRATRAEDHWILSGTKTFVTLAPSADFALVLARTGKDKTPSLRALTFFIVDLDRPGCARGQRLKKLGMHGADTAELNFQDVSLPDECVLGGVGDGMLIHMATISNERLAIGVESVALARYALNQTVEYCRTRKTLGGTLFDLQGVRFKIAEMSMEARAGLALVEQAERKQLTDSLRLEDTATLKYWTTEMLGRVVDAAVQLHGGYGCMEEYPIARLYRDVRLARIYGGTNELMKEIVSRNPSIE